jgi:hypothetical protein
MLPFHFWQVQGDESGSGFGDCAISHNVDASFFALIAG